MPNKELLEAIEYLNNMLSCNPREDATYTVRLDIPIYQIKAIISIAKKYAAIQPLLKEMIEKLDKTSDMKDVHVMSDLSEVGGEITDVEIWADMACTVAVMKDTNLHNGNKLANADYIVKSVRLLQKIAQIMEDKE